MKITLEIKDKDIKKLMKLLAESDIEILSFGELVKEKEYISIPIQVPSKQWWETPTITCMNSEGVTTPNLGEMGNAIFSKG